MLFGITWYKNQDILLFINIFPRVQKCYPFFDQTYRCWDNLFIQSKFKWLWKRKPTSVDKRSNNSEKGSQTLFVLISFLFSIETPTKLIHYGYIKKIKEKSIRTGVGFLFQNHFNFDWMKKLSQQLEVGFKKRSRFWARGKISIKSKILRFMYHDYHTDVIWNNACYLE